MTQHWAGGEAPTVTTVPKPNPLWIGFTMISPRYLRNTWKWRFLILLGTNSSPSVEVTPVPCRVRGRHSTWLKRALRTKASADASGGRREDSATRTSEPTAFLAAFVCAWGFLFEEIHLNDQIFHIAFHTVHYAIHSEWFLEIMQRLGNRHTFFSVHQDPVGQ